MQLQYPEPEDLLCDESFQRFCRGENQHDIQEWEQWISLHPQHAAVVNKARQLLDIVSAGQGNKLEQLAALKDAMNRRERLQEMLRTKPEEGTAAVTPSPVKSMRRRTYLAYAASVIGLVTAGSLLYLKYGSAGALRQQEFRTAQSARKTVVLPDNSVVMLNENSHLAISKRFSASHREVTITGEAFFDIKTDAAHPFVVNTGDYSIRVLGTSFNVKSYPGEATETDLITGKVEITGDGNKGFEQRIVLIPREKFVWRRDAVSSDPASLHALNTASLPRLTIDTITRQMEETAWMRTKIEINNETLEQIVQKLQGWYGIEIVIPDNDVRQYRYTATFHEETVFEVLKYLQQSYPFTYKIEGHSIIITGK